MLYMAFQKYTKQNMFKFGQITMKKKGVLYTRVSSDPQEEQGFSIPAQEKFGREFATKENIEIVEVFSESHTAKQAGRPEFNNMLAFLKNTKMFNTLQLSRQTGF